MYDTTLLDAALRYAARGWSIIPTEPNSKKPAGKWKQYQERPADEGQIRRWFGNGQAFGIAVIFGEVSGGLVCRDFDVMEGYQRWADDHADLAAMLPTVATVRGRHVYFRADHRGIVKTADGELRGAGYCLLPPSRHPDGPRYNWLVPLPDGEIPFVADVHAAGLLPVEACYTEHTGDTEIADNAESTGNGWAVSAVSSVLQGDGAIPPEGYESLIRGCLPTGPGRRNRQVFELARSLKGIPELASAAPDSLRAIVKRWYALALPDISTKEFTETWIDFLKAWPRVKIPKGATMASIMQRALEAPLPKAAERYAEEPIRQLIALCRQLGQEAGDGPFYLACRTAADLLGVSHVQANRWLFLLAHDGVVEQLNKGNRGSRKAAEYRYHGD
jgi:hypothetical protein